MKLAIYHTTDVHGYIFPTNYVNYQNLGLLKILSYIDTDKKNYDGHLLLDGGDLIQGSAMTNYLSKNSFDINPIMKLVTKAGYDAFVLGNHEFNYGLDYLYHSYDFIKDKVLNSNIAGLKISNKPYNIFNVSGKKIAVFGATTKYIPNWERDENIQGLKFNDPVELYGKYEDEMKENSDYIVVLYHGGFEKSLDENFIPTEKLNGENQASELLEKYDSIDIILSGHQHRSFITKIKDVICSQPINNARNFTKIVLDTETGNIEYELIDVASLDIEINKEYIEIFNDVNKDLETYLQTIVGRIDENIMLPEHFDVRLNGHPYINILHRVQLEASGADFSSTTLFDTAIGFEKEISIRDILVNYPYPNTLKVLEVKGSDIKHAIEISSSYFLLDEEGKPVINPKYIYPKLRNYIYDFYYGFDYEVDLTKPIGSRVISIKKDGKDIDLNAMYSIVVNNYRASNVNEYPCYEGKKVVKEINFDMSELLIEFFEKNGDIKINKEKNYKFIY